jgi:hypothetical protein
MVMPIVGMSQNIIPDDSTNTNLIYVSDFFFKKKTVTVFEYNRFQKEYVEYKGKIKNLKYLKGGYFNMMVIKLPNKKQYAVGYHNFLAVINRCKIRDIQHSLESGGIFIVYQNNQLSLACKE